MHKKKNSFLAGYLLFATFYLLCCDNKPEQKNTMKPVDYIKEIPGINDSIPAHVSEKGKVLIAYSDCYTCHKEGERSVGPSFEDIAKRYPHPKLSMEDAKVHTVHEKVIY